MDNLLILKILTLCVGFYMAWNIGANDVSNAMGTSVGSKALTLRRACILAAILEFCGAFFAGSEVSETMQRGLINVEMFRDKPIELVLGMCAALLGTGLWLQIASYFGWPVSTTHAIVGSIIGFGALVGGASSIDFPVIGKIAASWVISPFIAGLIAFALFSILQQKVLFSMYPVQAARKLFPFLYGTLFLVFSASFLINGIDNLNFSLSSFQIIQVSLSIGLIVFLISKFFFRKKEADKEACEVPHIKHIPQAQASLDKVLKHLKRLQANSFNHTHLKATELYKEAMNLKLHIEEEVVQHPQESDYATVEKQFAFIQIMSACFVAFAHGANDVANAIGPVAAVLDIIQNGITSNSSPTPSWLLALGGLGIVIGLATWGWRVIETIGKKITELTPTRGYTAEFSAATTILIASKLGLPISTTHCLVGAVLGVGLARGLRALNLQTLKDIVLSWIITLPASAISAILLFMLLKKIFV
jgi:inorganic phosphate transporter, PiT family